MADALSLGATYSSVQGRARPLPMEHAPALLTVLAALFSHRTWRGRSLCVLEALRVIVGGANMTTPSGACTGGDRLQPSPCARRADFSLGVGASAHCNHLASLRYSCSGRGLSTTTQYVEALKPSSIKMGAYQETGRPEWTDIPPG